MFRRTPCLLGATLWALASSAPAAPFFQDDFQSGSIDSRWDFTGVHYGAPVILDTAPLNSPSEPVLNPTRFLGEFGGAQDAQDPPNPLPGDMVQLHLTLPSNTASVSLDFDVYMLRTWDGVGVTYAGPDTFGYGYNNRTLLSKTFSDGLGEQSYCRFTTLAQCESTFQSDPVQKNRLGFNVELPDANGNPPQPKPMSLVYHIHTSDPIDYGANGPIPYSGGGPITFFFFSNGLQLADASHPMTADESWGLDNVSVTVLAAAIPEPNSWALMVPGLTLLLLVSRRRRT